MRSWWLIAFFLLCSVGYERSNARYERNIAQYGETLTELQAKKQELLIQQSQLQQEIASQSDPQWIELTLMKRLGMIPSGQKKIVFKESHGR